MPEATAKPTPSLRSAFGFSMAQKYLAFFIQLATTIALARLLTPHDTGVFSLAVAAVAMGQLLRDFGVADYIIAQKDVSQDKLRSAFTLTVLMAWGIAIVLLLVAHPLARFYAEPAVATVLQLLCINFLLLPFGTVSFAMLSKQMQFGRIFAVQTSASVLGAVVTLWAAWAGMGAVSMALGQVLGNVWTIGFLLLVQPGSVFMKPRFQGLKDLMRFGGALTAARLMEQGAGRSSDFIVAGTLGFHAGGLLSKAASLIGSFHEYFNSAVMRVATPALARTEAGSEEERSRYMQTTVMVATALWLFYPFLGLFSHEIVLLLFGAAWLECVPVLQISCIGAMSWGPFMLASSLLTARSAVGAQVRIQLLSAPLTVAALVIGSQFDLVTLVLATHAAMGVRLLMLQRALTRHCAIPLAPVLRALLPSAAVGAVASAAAWGFKSATAGLGLPLLLLLALAGLVSAVAAILAAWALRHPAFIELQGLVRPRLARLRA